MTTQTTPSNSPTPKDPTDVLHNQEILDQIALRSARLAEISQELKSELFGIDDVIDRVISSVRAWYVLPQIITRPVIICLWGLTGTGKTQLTRQLAKKLGFYSKFVEVQMDGISNDSGSIGNNISSMLNESLDQGETGILVLDEFQRFRTIDAQGKDVKVERYMEVWALLSDGRLAPSLAFMQELQMQIADAKYSEDAIKARRERNASGSEWDGFGESGFEIDEAPNPRSRKFRLRPYDAQRLKSILKLREPMLEIMSWSSEVVMQRMQDHLENPSAWETNFSKLLIFICGNLDEMYSDMATRVEDCDTDADIFHALTKQLSVIDVKRSLATRFKPEQIARLGNSHIIYPSFSRATFERLITSNVELQFVDIQKTSGLVFRATQNLLHQLYINGVFPSQGTRPLFSSIHSILSGALVEFTLWGLEQGAKVGDIITLDTNVKNSSETNKPAPINSSVVIATWGEKTFSLPVNLEISQLKERSDDNFRALIAVHEAGHALLYLVLHGRAPLDIKINPASFVGGYNTYINRKANTAKNFMDAVCVHLGGRAAEMLIFGKEYITSGAVNDLKHATQLVAEYVRYCGFSERLSRTDRTSDESDNVNTDMAPTNVAIEKLLQEQHRKAITLLEERKDTLLEISNALLEHGTLTRDDFSQWLQCAQLVEDRAIDPFAKMLLDASSQQSRNPEKHTELF